MADKIMVAVASALAAKAADAVAEAAKGAWVRLLHLVRERFGSDESASAALEAARDRPDDQAAITGLASALDRVAADDQRFAGALRSLWAEIGPQLPAGEASAVNVVTGSVGGHLLQARDLHVEGGLHLGDVQGPQRSRPAQPPS